MTPLGVGVQVSPPGAQPLTAPTGTWRGWQSQRFPWPWVEGWAPGVQVRGQPGSPGMTYGTQGSPEPHKVPPKEPCTLTLSPPTATNWAVAWPLSPLKTPSMTASGTGCQ